MIGREERKTALMLDNLLSRHQSGESDARFSPPGEGDTAQEFNALVELAVQVKEAFNPPGPEPTVYRRVQRDLFLKLDEKRTKPARSIRAHPGRRLQALPALLVSLLVIVMLSATMGVVSVSAGSLPGDLLYPVKTGVEDVRLVFTFHPEGELSLISSFSEERVREMAALSGAGRYQDFEAAAARYSRTLEKLLSVRAALQSSGDAASVSALDEVLNQQVETLQRVQEQVPDQAANAIQSVLDHALSKGQGRQDGGDKPEAAEPNRRATQTVKSQERQEEKDFQTAQQLARKHGLTVEQVLGLFHSTCEGDWKCVREVYRELEKGN